MLYVRMYVCTCVIGVLSVHALYVYEFVDVYDAELMHHYQSSMVLGDIMKSALVTLDRGQGEFLAGYSFKE